MMNSREYCAKYWKLNTRESESTFQKTNAFFFLHSFEIWDAGRIRTHCKQSKADRRSDCSTWLFLLVSVNGQWLVSCRQTKCSHDIVKYNERETGNKDHVWAESQRLLCHYWKGLGQQTLTNKLFVWKSPSPVLIFLCLFSFKALRQLRYENLNKKYVVYVTFWDFSIKSWYLLQQIKLTKRPQCKYLAYQTTLSTLYLNFTEEIFSST